MLAVAETAQGRLYRDGWEDGPELQERHTD